MKIYTHLYFLLLLLLSHIGYGQQLSSIQQQYNTYTQKTVQEKIFLHTDRATYLPGETVWFKAYVVEGSTMHLFDLSKVAYLEIIGVDNVPVLQTKFALNEGVGQGSFFLPASITSGNYVLRCYTSWMKNFDEAFFFEMPLTVINPFLAFEPYAIVPKEAKYDMQFFPEGGQLVEGLESKVAFRAINHEGRGIQLTGKVVTSRGETIATFSSSRVGIGTFQLNPQRGERYQAIITDEKGNSFTYDLPNPIAEGYVLQLTDTTGTHLTWKVQAKGMSSESLVIAYHTRQHQLHIEPIVLNENTATINIAKSKLLEGISHFTLMNQQGIAYCERLYFTYPKKQLALQLATDKPLYNQKQRVVLSLQTPSLQSLANMSVSVVLKDEINQTTSPNIATYLWLLADLKGNVESPQYYFQDLSSRVVEAMDHLMLTHGWRRFNWKNVNQGNISITHLPEVHGHFIQAKVANQGASSTVPGMDVFLSSPEKPVRLYVSQVDKEGMVRWEVKDFYGTRELTIQNDWSMDSTKKFSLLNPFSIAYTNKLPVNAFSFDTTLKQNLQQRAIAMQLGNAYLPNNFKKGTIVLKDTLPFFGVPDETYLLDDYTRFPTMEEVLREYVRAVTVRKNQGKFELRMFDKILPNTFYKRNPLVLLDGIPVFDVDKIMAFDPLKIRKIEILAGYYSLGNYASRGIINFSTYNADLARFELNPNVYITAYEGLQVAREFYAPKYDTPASITSRIPDFRQVLHWEPQLLHSKEGKSQIEFYTGEQTGDYEVIVQGMTKEGLIGSSTIEFRVKAPSL